MTILTKKPNESSTYIITLTFLDVDNVAFIPASCVWSLTDTKGTILNGRDRVSETIDTNTYDFLLSGDDLIYAVGESKGKRVFTVEGTYDSTYGILPFREQVQFEIINTLIDAI